MVPNNYKRKSCNSPMLYINKIKTLSLCPNGHFLELIVRIKRDFELTCVNPFVIYIFTSVRINFLSFQNDYSFCTQKLFGAYWVINQDLELNDIFKKSSEYSELFSI